MNLVDRLIAILADWKAKRATERITAQAVDLNKELTALHYSTFHDRDREPRVRELAKEHPIAAIANIAQVRGFKHIARCARRQMRDEKVA